MTDAKENTLFGNYTKFWAIFGEGGIALRYGPFTKEEIGPMMERTVKEGIAVVFIAECGRDIPWKDMADWFPAVYPENPDEPEL